MSKAYYNEFDPVAAAWLRNLIAAGHIAPGDVDTRSITDVRPNDLAGYTQCHFFAGIGVWSYALRLAGWRDDRPIWTGSCPCQPFSAAGRGAGVDDERHLWPAWFWLISQCKPDLVVGEQVASPAGLGWLDLVHSDLEGAGYAVGAADLCAAGVGAPHIRQRTYFMAHPRGQRREVALLDERRSGAARRQRQAGGARVCSTLDWLDDAVGTRLEGLAGNGDGARGRTEPAGSVAATGESGWLAHDDEDGRGEHGGVADTGGERRQQVDRGASGDEGADGRRPDGDHLAAGDGEDGWLADASGGQLPQPQRGPQERDGHGSDGADDPRSAGRPSPTNGHWGAADWLLCRDGKWRPVEPGTFPLADGVAGRVGRLRGYGNAIVAPLAAAFIEVVMEEI